MLTVPCVDTTTPFEITYNYITNNTNGTTSTVLRNMLVGYDYHNYFYDSVGNIVRYNVNGKNIGVYTYDVLNQLKTETRANGDVYEYTYDNGGNIQSVKKNGSLSKGFSYDDTWTDLLTSYNGMSITYDEIGNPTHYWDGANFTWSNGRQLTSVSYGIYTIQYSYNADGLRTIKNNNGVITEYYWLDGVLLGEKTGDDYIIYLYDENGTPYGFIDNNTYYYYVQNAQGDIIGILDTDGNTIVEYTYSAWGEMLSITGSKATTIGRKNPLRYRGYYYDNETGFYYLQSRYYDPITCRFINADGYVSTGQGILGTNMFAYCGNNPVNQKDSTGQLWEYVVAVAVFTVVAAVIINSVISKNSVDENYNNNSAKETSVSINEIVNDQTDDSVSGLSVGVGNVSNNGCGAVAIHNAKVLKGKDSTMSDTIKDVQNSGGLILAGTLGVNPFVINNILKKSDIESTPVRLNELHQPGTYIIAYWNSEDIMDGAHFVTIVYDGNTYISYNYSGDELNPQNYAKNYIYGYRIN